MVIETLHLRDQKHVWHPCSQMKDYEQFKPLIIKSASGSYITLENGHSVIDAISSWWCKLLGHNHPRLKEALLKQVDQFEHVILANTTHENIVNLSERLGSLLPGLTKVSYAGDGSCAVEMALKMSLQARRNQGDLQRTQFIALKNGYHGETCGAMSVSDLGLYRAPFAPLLFETKFIDPMPYVSGVDDPLWLDCADAWKTIEESLLPYANTATAIIVEPIIQGAAGMRIYSQDLLKRLRAWTKQHGIHLIADEIMTGLGRTGKLLAAMHADIVPDFLCLSKNLTSGWLAFSAMITTDEIYQCFYADYATQKSFLHSHTFCGNAMGASIALEVLDIIDEENICEKANALGNVMLVAMQQIVKQTGALQNVRQIGAMVAADLITEDPSRRLGFEIFQEAVKLGALLRPLGNTIYWLPPVTTDFETISMLQHITQHAIEKVLGN